jgi:pimeloyl-ACP methyl ester carboxylesterase
MRALASVAGALLALPVLVLAAVGLRVGYSLSGWLMIAAAVLAAGGMIAAPMRSLRVRRWRLARAGLALFAFVVLVRLVLASYGATTMTTLPAAGSRWLARAIDEQDACLVGALGLVWKWSFLPPMEKAQLVPAMHDAYVAMRASEGTTPSPVLDTFLGRQSPDAFDAIVVEPRASSAKTALVFLHGYAGSFTLECWMMAEAARAIDAVTVCPATGFDGRWWTQDGERTLRATLAYLAGRGIARVYLAGLSNGGIGASKLAPRFASSLSGLVLISGASPDGSAARLPTLVVQGESDTNVSAASARAFAVRDGATYASFQGALRHDDQARGGPERDRRVAPEDERATVARANAPCARRSSKLQ